MAVESICAIDGCGKKMLARGMCRSHYYRMQRYGNPFYSRLLKAEQRDGVYALHGGRVCKLCREARPATAEFFRKKGGGLAATCKNCDRDRDNRRERWAVKTAEQKAHHSKLASAYSKTIRGRAGILKSLYNRVDLCDLTTDEIAAIIAQPCTYCGTTFDNRGLDRISNELPHVRGNVVACCTACNIMRGDRFTVDEMRLIGEVIARIIAARPPKIAVPLGPWGTPKRELDDRSA